jgi:hypothetical protein
LGEVDCGIPRVGVQVALHRRRTSGGVSPNLHGRDTVRIGRVADVRGEVALHRCRRAAGFRADVGAGLGLLSWVDGLGRAKTYSLHLVGLGKAVSVGVCPQKPINAVNPNL